MIPARKNTAILLMHCPDQTGLVAAVTDFLFKNNGNILDLDQYVDQQYNRFFMRVEWALDGFSIPGEKIDDYFGTLVGHRYQMKWQLHFTKNVPRMAIFVSKLSHNFYDILQRYISKEWRVEIPVIISNHPDLAEAAAQYGIEYHYFPIDKGNKQAQELKELELLKKHRVDFVVLARYMQILSGNFIAHFENNIINIHHSFLPAFSGAKPYHQAFERGVKIIGATSHYATVELDQGPIIAQDIQPVTHNDGIRDLIRKGKDLEKTVLSRAIWLHLQHRILPYGNKTIVFE